MYVSSIRTWAVGLAGVVLASSLAAISVPVSSTADSGAGSFRAAVEAANADSTVDSIVFDIGLGTVTLASSVEYTGAQALAIFGSDNTVTGAGAFDLFRSTGGGELWIGHLTFADSGGDGVQVDVPAAATGDLKTTLYRVTISGSAGFGLLVEDKVEASDAGIALELHRSAITGNGTPLGDGGADDQDGIRLNEGGLGGITLDMSWSAVTDNAYDGIELDEEGEGDIEVSVANSSFVSNGAGNPADIEDGLDVDEADAGNVEIALVHSLAERNEQEGFDLNETGEGDITVNANKTRSIDNGTDEDGRGLDVEEEDGGSLTFHAQASEFSRNQEDGIRNSESGSGNLSARLLTTQVRDNLDDGFDGEQDDDGSGVLRVQRGSRLSGNDDDDIELDGVTQKP